MRPKVRPTINKTAIHKSIREPHRPPHLHRPGRSAARMMIKCVPMLLLDEATSTLDSEVEATI